MPPMILYGETMKRHWIFQGNPDVFPMHEYIAEQYDIVWSVRQKHLADKMRPGDQVFLWVSAGKQKGVAGIIAKGSLTSEPEMMRDDEISQELWDEGKNLELRVRLSIKSRCLGAKEIVRRDWLLEDPVLSDMSILKMASGTNFLLQASEAERLSLLVKNTGRPWNDNEALAGLWAYAHTYGGPVSRLPGSHVSMVAMAIGRAMTGVYNKVMNFRALDPRDSRKGLSAGSQVDKDLWDAYFKDGELDLEELDRLYLRLWGTSTASGTKKIYRDFGEAPDDNIADLRIFAAKVRKGQPKFRENLLEAYGSRCAISGHGPEHVLEAVHIVPHAVSGINKLDNGLLLRADLHSLFDAQLITIDPETKVVSIDSGLSGTPYTAYHGTTLRKREDGSQISPEYLEQVSPSDSL